MSLERWSAVDEYLGGLLLGEDPVLEETRRASAAAGLPAHGIAPNQGALLALLVGIAGARRVLEIGTLGGYSTIWLARAAEAVVTIEADRAYGQVARANLERAGVGEKVDVRVGRALDVLPGLEGPFDLVFIDADKQHHDEYLSWGLRLSRPGTVIVADNVVRDGAICDSASDDPRVQGVRRFFDVLAAEPRLDATAIQTVGSKGWDGFALAVVRG